MNKVKMIEYLEDKSIRLGTHTELYRDRIYIKGYKAAIDDIRGLLDDNTSMPAIPQWIADIIESEDYDNPIYKLNMIITDSAYQIGIESRSPRFLKYLEDINAKETEEINQEIEKLMMYIATKDYKVKAEPVIHVSINYFDKEEKIDIDNISFSKFMEIMKNIKK